MKTHFKSFSLLLILIALLFMTSSHAASLTFLSDPSYDESFIQYYSYLDLILVGYGIIFPLLTVLASSLIIVVSLLDKLQLIQINYEPLYYISIVCSIISLFFFSTITFISVIINALLVIAAILSHLNEIEVMT